MSNIANSVYNVLWSPVLIVFIIVVGVIFSIMTRFVQVRLIKDMVVQMFKGKSSKAGVSSFQALSVALSGRVGTGNIAGVATAIAYGGPGAVFWMWLIAFFGAATSFVESTLGQIYKTKQDGEYRGGPAYYIEKGLGYRWYGIIFAVAALIAMAILMPGVQSNAIASSFQQAFSLNKWITGILIILCLAFIIFGGLKRIANTAQLIVPFMALGYILVALIIIVMNIEKVPAVFQLIFSSAFGMNQVFGGIIGSAISWGVQRGIYSNEAGQGTGPHAASAAEVSHPAKQGLVQSFSIYIDTLLVCSATAFMIIFTGSFNVYAADGETLLVDNIGQQVEVGPNYTQTAIDANLSGFGSPFVAISLFFFAFTTIMAYYYISEVNVVYLLGNRNKKVIMFVLKIVLLASTMFGAIREAKLAWTFGDIGLGLMVWLNLIAIVFLYKPAIQALKDYEIQKKKGLDPRYNSSKLGVKNADYWENGYSGDEEEAS
ncbi:alanine:cation symporter family protein [Caldibacillus lycopersici]|uniref:Alanine:cation symporter family protein n=1 Tax=Perspicuibacillus lycopersici TaxID=1325689 RepID=A0AAE3IX34_9BACI|nr:alanine/glycine:cation symporter family protein [Perspicuibacillus lycopersici]MCU9614976.1 alanine:cation symporter family protein [Perspicuibacillus lycopersici]